LKIRIREGRELEACGWASQLKHELSPKVLTPFMDFQHSSQDTIEAAKKTE